MNKSIYHTIQAHKIIQYVAETYGVEPEFLWPTRYPTYSVLRNPENQKWFGVIMSIPGIKLDLNIERNVEIIDLKFDKNQATDFVRASGDAGIRLAYHMNKQNWVTIVLDHNKLADRELLYLINKSYKLAGQK